MRNLKTVLAALAIAVAATAAARAEPLLIRNSYVVPVVQLGADDRREEGLGQALGQVLRDGGGALSGHADDDHGARQRRAGNRQPRLFDARHRHRERRHQRSPRHLRRFPRRRSRLLQQPVLRPQGLRHQEDRGPQGQGARHQRDRRRRRHRHEGRTEEARPPRQARLHRDRGAAADHAVDAQRQEGRPCHGGDPVRAQPAAQRDRLSAVRPDARASAHRSSCSGPRGNRGSTRTAPR